ncbi:MAG TPA: hypothetical protein P5259_01310 [Candidatus Bipolaricaulis sp.]|nr:hypothetical protein [Candidatus Bipolaricaulis sp.]HRU21943.1 hypothetical protein [Candidatus Bipolaricaulis sp.]
MTRRWLVWGLVLLVGATACADTLHLKSGQKVGGELCGVTADSVAWCATGGLQVRFPLGDVARVEFSVDPLVSPRLEEREWRAAMRSAQRELTSCRSARYGLILGGLTFVGGGYWLGIQGYEAGNVIIALGAVAAGLGVIAPSPRCPLLEERVKTLTRIGLDHGWLY